MQRLWMQLTEQVPMAADLPSRTRGQTRSFATMPATSFNCSRSSLCLKSRLRQALLNRSGGDSG